MVSHASAELRFGSQASAQMKSKTISTADQGNQPNYNCSLFPKPD